MVVLDFQPNWARMFVRLNATVWGSMPGAGDQWCYAVQPLQRPGIHAEPPSSQCSTGRASSPPPSIQRQPNMVQIWPQAVGWQ